MKGSGVMAWITKEKRLAIYLRDAFACGYCGTDLRQADPAAVTLDHLVPRCKGGGNDPTNLITSCRPCNCVAKHMKTWTDFAPGGAVKRIEYLRNQPLNTELTKALIEGTTGDEAVEAKS